MLREPITLLTSDGLTLEGELISPDQPWGAAVLTHPHPQHGGNMRSMVPGELAEALPAQGVAVLRFNFRGVERSQGTFDNGDDERLDVVAAVDAMYEIVEGMPLLVFGSSFGADTALSVADSRIDAYIACAPPLRDEKLNSIASVAHDSRPKLLVVAERDNFRNADGVNAVTEDWSNTEVVVIPGSDHYFVGNLDKVGRICVEYALKFKPV